MANYHPRHLGLLRHYPDLRILLQGSMVPGEVEVRTIPGWG